MVPVMALELVGNSAGSCGWIDTHQMQGETGVPMAAILTHTVEDAVGHNVCTVLSVDVAISLVLDI
jgi:hypothetical protein